MSDGRHTATERVRLDLLDPGYSADPYPALARLRALDPVHQDRRGVWFVTRHADVSMLGRDSRLGRDLRRSAAYAEWRPYLADSALERCVESWMISLDPPAHTRLRRLAARALARRPLSALTSVIEAIADELLGAIPDGEPFDLMTRYAEVLPLSVMLAVLGLPTTDYERMKRWSDRLGPVVEPRFPLDARERASDAVVEMIDALKARIAERQGKVTCDDLLDSLIVVDQDGDRLDPNEIVTTAVLLVVAAHEATANLIGNGMLALLRHPAELDRLRGDAALLPRAVEELLRYDGAPHISARVAHEEIEIGGKVIGAGQVVFCMLGAANRDPEVFTEPDRLDLGRDPNPHVGFGGGVHTCLGAALARLVGKVAFERLLQRWRSFTVDEDALSWRSFVNLRGLSRLPMTGRT